MPVRIPDNFQDTIILLSKILSNHQYAFRGTTSLVLQGIEMNVDDIDILCDKETALTCNKLLKNYLIEPVQFSESDKFKSYFGKLAVNNITVEVMGEWQIKDNKGNWSAPFNANKREILELNNNQIFVTPIESELVMFALMGRWNAYHKTRKQAQKRGMRHRPPCFKMGLEPFWR